jgi:hypothetical protein
VRLNNVSQLSGFAKRDDLRYFSKMICDIDYDEKPEFAPTQDILDEYRKSKGGWSNYAMKFLDLMARRIALASTAVAYFVAKTNRIIAIAALLPNI